jgi:hypothetical protein
VKSQMLAERTMIPPATSAARFGVYLMASYDLSEPARGGVVAPSAFISAIHACA